MNNFGLKTTARSKPEWFVGAEILEKPEFKVRTNYTSVAFKRRNKPTRNNKTFVKTREEIRNELQNGFLKTNYRIRASEL